FVRQPGHAGSNARVAKAAAVQNFIESSRQTFSGQPERYLLRFHRGRNHYRRDEWPEWNGGPIELSHSGRAARQPRSEFVLARSPLVPGEYQSDKRSRALVQELIPAAHGRQEANRNSRQPRANETPSRVVWFVILIGVTI